MRPVLRHADSDAEIRSCFPVMRELRPHLTGPEELLARVRSQGAESYRILAAWESGAPVGVAGYRWQENLIHGRFCYVDDLVVSASTHRGGLGAVLLDGVSAEVRVHGAGLVVLDTSLNNALGQRFYLRYGLLPTALHFAKPVAREAR